MTQQSLEEQVGILVRLTALQVLGERSGAEGIAILGRVGMDVKTIAELLGTTEATVRSRLSKERKKQDDKVGPLAKVTLAKSDSGDD